MPRPGVDVTLVPTPPTRGVPTETGPAFFAGVTTTQQDAATKVQNIDQFKAKFGAAAAGSDLYNAADVFFREGGTVLWVSSMAAAGDLETALDRFDAMLGPGQVAAPGVTDEADYKLLIAHALDRNRVALLDPPKTAADAAALITVASALNVEQGAKFSALFGNWLQYSGPGGTTLEIAPSAVAAGLIARNDRRNSPNVPAAGQNGVVNGASSLVAEYGGTEAEDLNEAGVNLFRDIYGDIELYGYRSLSLKDTDPNWWMFNHARLFIGIKAICQAVAETVVFAEIDGQRKRLAQFEGDLVGELLPLYTAGSLYGATPDEAFMVDAVSTIANPDEQLAEGIVRANVAVRMSPFAEYVIIPITKVAITDALPVAA
jgi:Phage tail sheath protein subtilisin-like domain